MSAKRTRGRVLLLVGTSVALVASVLFVFGDRRADQALDDVRDRARFTKVTSFDFLEMLYDQDASIAERLEVDPAGVDLVQVGPNEWCLRVTVRRLLVARSAAFAFEVGATLSPVPSC